MEGKWIRGKGRWGQGNYGQDVIHERIIINKKFKKQRRAGKLAQQVKKDVCHGSLAARV